MRIRQGNKLWEVNLGDDGTLDTVITVQPVAGNFPEQEVRFSDTSDYRRNDGSLTMRGFRELAKDAISDYDADMD